MISRRFSVGWAAVFVVVPAIVLVFPGYGRGEEKATFEKADVFEAVDRAYLRGEIDWGTRHIYRVSALKAPEKLPVRFQDYLVYGRASNGCYTAVLLEARSDLPHVDFRHRVELERLFLPPPDLNYTIDVNSPYPVRVTYDDTALANKAQIALDAAVESYNQEVTNWGWIAPPIESGAQYYRIRLTNSGMGGGGYTDFIDTNPSTPHADYYTYVVVDQANPNTAIPPIVAHEFNHACQAATDAAESMGFWENTASYVMSQVYPNAFWYTEGFFPDFQGRPYLPLEWMSQMGTDGYEYGAALWVIFMEYMYGNNDPAWVRQIWTDSMQNSWNNEPDYFDIIHNRVQNQGGFPEMVRTFAQYRYFVGTDADGRHLPASGGWVGSEVQKEATWTTSDLPLLNRQPQSGRGPQPNGCNYIVGQVNTLPFGPIQFSFSGQTGASWNVDVLKVTSADTTYQRMNIDASNQGTLTETVQTGDELVMVVCNVAQVGYDPDAQNWTARSYTYNIQYVTDPLTVTAVEPNMVQRGSQGVALTVRGTGFIDAAGLAVQISGASVVVTPPVFVSSAELRVQVNVDAQAQLGARDVIVMNPDGQTGIGTGLLTITDNPVQSDGGVSDGGPGSDGGPDTGPGKGGCHCRAASDPGPSPAMLLLVMTFLFAGLRRSKRRRPRGRND